MGGGDWYPSCSCQPQLDLLNKFHHLDRDHALGKMHHTTKEEVHHCGTIDGETIYQVKHCSCEYEIECEACRRGKRCAARTTHAINRQKVDVFLHLDFIIDIPSILSEPIEIKFLEPCKEFKGYWHISATKRDIKWSARDTIQIYQGYDEKNIRLEMEIAKLRPDAEWALRMRTQLKELKKQFGL